MKPDLTAVPQIPDHYARILQRGGMPSINDEAIIDRHIAAACAAMRDRKAAEQDPETRWEVPGIAAVYIPRGKVGR
jgi:hypothetical protein